MEEGDCFFDAVAQGLKQLKPGTNFTVKSLREVCKKFTESQLENDHSWLKEALKGENEQINEYIPRIEFTADDVEQKPEPNILGMTSPIWGRSEIEGKIICKVYGVQLHIIEKYIVEEKEKWTDQLVSSWASSSVGSIDYSEENTVHIINIGNLHFDPILCAQEIPYRLSDSDDERIRNRELFTAIQKGDLDRVKLLLGDGVKTDIIDRNNKDNSPLHYAVERGKKEIVEELLHPKWKTDIDALNNENRKPLDIAQYLGRQDIVEILKSRIQKNLQASVEQSSTKRKRTKTDSEEDRMEDTSSKKLKTSSQAVEIVGLDQAEKVLGDKELEVVSIVEEYSANKAPDILITSIEEKQQSVAKSNKPLQDHIPYGRNKFLLNFLKLAKTCGIESWNTPYKKVYIGTAQSKLTITLLGAALELDDKKVIICISKLAKNKGELEKVLNAISHTIELKNGKILHYAPIAWAIQQGNLSRVRTILSLARERGLNKLACDSLFIAIKFSKILAVSYIIKNFVVPNIIDESMDTLLHVAVAYGNTRMVEVLIENDAYVNAEDGISNTPLHVAVENNNVKMVDALLHRGANVNAQNCQRSTPLHVAVENNNVEIVGALLNRGADTNVTNYKGNTPTHFAVKSNNVEVLDALLNRGADKNVRNYQGYTPLHLSVLNGYKEILSCILEWTRPDINSRLQIGTDCDTTLLLSAAKSRHAGVVEFLIEEGARIDINYLSNGTDFLEYLVCNEVEMVKTLIALETRLDYFEESEELYDLIQSKLSSDLVQQMLEYRSRCIDERERMKEKQINKNCTFYDILKSKEINKLASYVRDKNMREKLEEAKSEFPIFADRIESQYQKGKERLDLLEQGSSNLHKVFPPKAFLYNILTSEEANKLASSLREKDMENKLEEAKSEFPILAYLIESQHKTVTEILDLLEQVSSNLPRVIPAEVSLQIFELLDNIDIKRFNEVINGIEKWIGRAFFMHRGKESSECFSAPNIEEPSNKVREVNIESVNEVVIGRRT